MDGARMRAVAEAVLGEVVGNVLGAGAECLLGDVVDRYWTERRRPDQSYTPADVAGAHDQDGLLPHVLIGRGVPLRDGPRGSFGGVGGEFCWTVACCSPTFLGIADRKPLAGGEPDTTVCAERATDLAPALVEVGRSTQERSSYH